MTSCFRIFQSGSNSQVQTNDRFIEETIAQMSRQAQVIEDANEKLRALTRENRRLRREIESIRLRKLDELERRAKRLRSEAKRDRRRTRAMCAQLDRFAAIASNVKYQTHREHVAHLKKSQHHDKLRFADSESSRDLETETETESRAGRIAWANDGEHSRPLACDGSESHRRESRQGSRRIRRH